MQAVTAQNSSSESDKAAQSSAAQLNITAGMRAGHYGAPITIRYDLLGAGPPQVRLAAANDHLPGWPGARELRRLARPAGRCETAIQPVPWQPETMQGRWPTGPVKTANPFRVHPDTGGS